MQQYVLLSLVASLLHTTTSTIYYVMPDNHYHPINDNTYTLQHYLNNNNKYFTSNTQLHFLPGQYYLNNDLIIQGVSNFSLIGNRTNKVISTVINCTSPAGIAVVGSSNIVIANIAMNECGNDYSAILNDHSIEMKFMHFISLLFLQCKNITCTHFYTSKDAGSIELINPLVNMQLSNLTIKGLGIWYNEHADNANHAILVNNFRFHDNNSDLYTIQIKQFNMSSNVSVVVQHVNFTNTLALHIICVNCTGHSSLLITDCNFTSKQENIDPVFYDYDYDDDHNDYHHFDEYDDYEVPVYVYNTANNFTHSSSTVYAYYQDCGNIHTSNKIQLINCHFINNVGLKELIQVTQNNIYDYLVNLSIIIIRCTFHNNQYVQILSANCYNDDLDYCILLLIKNTIISSNTHFKGPLIYAYMTITKIEQIMVISNVGVGTQNSFFEVEEGYLQFNNYNEIFNNTLRTAIRAALSIHVQEDAVINSTSNTLLALILCIPQSGVITSCPIQYISKKGNLDEEFQRGDKLNYSIIFNNDNTSVVSNNNMMHCSWDSNLAFSTTRPALVNKRFISYNFSDNKHDYLCLCHTNKSKNCYDKDFGPSYPGQTITFGFILAENDTKQALVSTMDLSDIECKLDADKSIVFQLYDKCKPIKYKVMYDYREWCEFALQLTIVHTPHALEIGMQVYTILLQPCPKGFSLNMEGYCQCDTILSSHIPSITHCNIDDQTILRPANSWISAQTVNNSHSYNVSLHCSFDYCLPHSSHLNLSTTDSQCQFNRSGLLCGQCQQGLSAVFGSSQCKQCSNVYLLIIIPIGIAGVVLVLLLFVLNLTVTNGNINGVLFYANIISINTPIFFPNSNTITHVLISLLNLDLGIETCFYSGMDDLAKKVLQLAFPVYLILIATFIIITSHYSSIMQRLTARRGLQVLATIFLLSYTKTLLAVSNVLFFYSTITHLPTNNTTPVWSVDANVPLFGIGFTILFTACILIFLLLIPFNMLLIFTRTLSQFRTVNYFKPILDAYQGPYKTKFYYWTGLQLLMRAVFFGLSALDRSTNVIVSVILLGVMIWLYEKASPFNNKLNNVIEILSLINLQALFMISYLSASDIIIHILVFVEMFQLVCIILVHLKMATCASYTINFSITNVISKCLVGFKQQSNKKDRREEINLQDLNSSPLVDYKEFREPLIGQW